MTSSAPATVPEMIAALNNRINVLEQEVQILTTDARPPLAASELDGFRQEIEGRLSNALNEMQARHEREMAGLALLRARVTP